MDEMAKEEGFFMQEGDELLTLEQVYIKEEGFFMQEGDELLTLEQV